MKAIELEWIDTDVRGRTIPAWTAPDDGFQKGLRVYRAEDVDKLVKELRSLHVSLCNASPLPKNIQPIRFRLGVILTTWEQPGNTGEEE